MTRQTLISLFNGLSGNGFLRCMAEMGTQAHQRAFQQQENCLHALYYIAITNVIHCNAGNINGGAPLHMRYNCAHNLAGLNVTKKEIEILKPHNIVSLSGRKIENYIKEWVLNIPTLYLPHPSGRGVVVDDLINKISNFLDTKT